MTRPAKPAPKSRRSASTKTTAQLDAEIAAALAQTAARETPSHWVWAYHVAPKSALPSIKVHGLRPHRHAHVAEAPVIFVEPDREGIAPYYEPRKTVVLRFKTPGFGTTDDGESVIYGGSLRPGAPPDAPLTGLAGAEGTIPPKRLQVERDGTFEWLVS